MVVTRAMISNAGQSESATSDSIVTAFKGRRAYLQVRSSGFIGSGFEKGPGTTNFELGTESACKLLLISLRMSVLDFDILRIRFLRR